jgi:hypothetical protein
MKHALTSLGSLRDLDRVRNDALQTGIVTSIAFAKVPDRRCTASLPLALHRIRDT